jgi:signal transduction histidine kinase
MKGDVTLESTVAVGSCFILRLPRMSERRAS